MPAQMGGIVGGVIQLEQNREEEKQTDDLTIFDQVKNGDMVTVDADREEVIIS